MKINQHLDYKFSVSHMLRVFIITQYFTVLNKRNALSPKLGNEVFRLLFYLNVLQKINTDTLHFMAKFHFDDYVVKRTGR